MISNACEQCQACVLRPRRPRASAMVLRSLPTTLANYQQICPCQLVAELLRTWLFLPCRCFACSFALIVLAMAISQGCRFWRLRHQALLSHLVGVDPFTAGPADRGQARIAAKLYRSICDCFCVRCLSWRRRGHVRGRGLVVSVCVHPTVPDAGARRRFGFRDRHVSCLSSAGKKIEQMLNLLD